MNPRVIICDEQEKIRVLIRSILGNTYDCADFATAEDALEDARTKAPDLVLTELNLPDMSGIELCSTLKSTPGLALVPVVILTSAINDDSRAFGLESGADDYLFKPIRPRELRARTASLIRLSLARANLEVRTRELEAANRYVSQAQSALVQAEKLAMVGTLVAGVAHEVNNPLAFIQAGVGEIDLLMNKISALGHRTLAAEPREKTVIEAQLAIVVDQTRGILGDIGQGVDRLATITRDLLALSVTGSPQLVEVTLEAEIERAWKTAAARTKIKPRLVLQLESIPKVHSAPHLLGQVLLNIFVNAIQSMASEQGTVWCTAETADSQVRLAIRDEGPGIDPRVLGRIFDPFFTTKSPGKGTGLGLALCQGLMRTLGGTIDVASTPGKGATFTLTIPASSADVAHGHDAAFR